MFLTGLSFSAERSFSDQKLEEFRKDPDFSYIETEAPDDLFSNFLQAFFQKFFGMAGSAEAAKGVEIFLYLFSGIVLIYASTKLLKTNFSGLLVKKPASSVQITDLKEDIRELDLEDLLNDCIRQKDYRMATRYLFLMVLKDLNEKELISWSPEKTNRDYENELRKTKAGPDFSKLNRVFTYTWYGNFPVTETSYNSLSKSFESFRKDLGKIK